MSENKQFEDTEDYKESKKKSDKNSSKSSDGSLEKVITKKISPVVEEAIHKFLGVSIDELNQDISEKLLKSPLLDFDIDTSIPFKEAKKIFKRNFLRKMLRVSYGNISEVAKRIGVDRRSIHRIVKDAGIDVSRIREEMIRPYDIKQKAVSNLIEDVLDNYKTIIHPIKLENVYRNVDEVSKDIMDEIPIQEMSLKKAEYEFELAYFKKLLSEHDGNLSHMAKKIELRYETLLRKLKSLGLK